jgi:hypothetical protein
MQRLKSHCFPTPESHLKDKEKPVGANSWDAYLRDSLNNESGLSLM